MNITEINNTIQELENGNTTFDACIKLSALYNVRDRLTSDDVVKEYKDILPEYNNYREVKTIYQQTFSNEYNVLASMSTVCKEIKEFILMLYSNTDLPQERQLIINTINNIEDILTKPLI